MDKFDPAHVSGAKFSSYASWWIKQRVHRAVSQAGSIRLPARMPALIASVNAAREEFVLDIGREPTHAELAEAVGVSTNRLTDVLSASRGPVSFDKELADSAGGGGAAATGDARTLADVIPDESHHSPQEHLHRRMVRQTLARSLIAHLSPEEHIVVCSCYNLIEGREVPLTHVEVGRRFDKSVEWVAKVEVRVLRKFKGKSQLRNLLLVCEISVDGYGDGDDFD